MRRVRPDRNLARPQIRWIRLATRAPALAALLVAGCLPTVQGEHPTPPAPLDEPAFDDPDHLQVGAFNIDWLWDHYEGEYTPRNEVDYAMIAQLIVEYDLDLLALQEIDGEGALDLLGLPDEYRYVVGETGWSQNVALLYRADRVTVDRVREIPLPVNEWPSKDPLAAEVRAIGSDVAFTFVGVHLNPFASADDAAYREAQVRDLYSWLTHDLAAETDDPPFDDHVIVAGDFNDTFDGIAWGYDTLQPFEDDPGFTFATADTDDHTEIYFESQIDHVVLSAAMVPRYLNAGEPGACHVIAHDEISPYSDYAGGYGGRQNVSSHRPLWIYVALE